MLALHEVRGTTLLVRAGGYTTGMGGMPLQQGDGLSTVLP